MEKLQIRIDYDRKEGLSLSDFTNYLTGLKKEYARFTNKNSSLSIQSVKDGSVIFEFSQYVMVPIITGIVSHGVYEFGKYVINTLKHAENNMDSVLSKFKEKDKEAKNQVNTLHNVTEDFNTVNQINFYIQAPGKEDIKYSLDKDTTKQIHDSVFALKNVSSALKKECELYKSVELSLETVSKGEAKTYKGIIQSIENKSKKVIFADGIINQFNLENTFFKDKLHICSVNVHYNPNQSISQYEVVEYIGLAN